MARKTNGQRTPSGRRARRKPRFTLRKLWPRFATWRRWWRAFRRAPAGVQLLVATTFMLTLWLTSNWVYQVVRKPSELFFPVSHALYKTPAETWDSYAPIFRRHSTATLTPEFLAALAQVEGSGNPIVRTYWRWSWKPRPFEMYRPASSAVGMYQITDGTFVEARRYCIRNHRVIEDGPWHDWRSCWFNSLYMRVIPSHAAELTSAYLDVHVHKILHRNGITQATPQQKQNVAAVIHLCGAGAADRFVRRGMRPTPNQRCGDHDVARYLAKVNAMRRVFAQLAAKSQEP